MKKKYYLIIFISLIILSFYILFLCNKGLIGFLLVLCLIFLMQFFLSFIISTIFDTYENWDKIDKQKYYKRFLNFFNEYLKINEKNFIKLWRVYFPVSIFIWIICTDHNFSSFRRFFNKKKGKIQSFFKYTLYNVFISFNYISRRIY